MKLRVFLSFFILILATPAETKPVPPATTFLPKFEALIHQAMQEKKVPGLAVAIVMDGKVIFMKGFGVREVGRPEPVDTQTVFQIGSASKAITSVLVAILNRDQILSLDHPVETIPKATVRHILSHTTGIPSPGFNALIERGVPAVDVYKKVVATTPNGPPGEKFSYHNAVYSLIGEIIKRQSGLSFEDALQTRLLKPLHMTETSSTWDAFISRPNRASVHTFTKDKEKRGKEGKTISSPALKVPYRQDYANFPAAAGCSSSIHDMALLLAAIMGTHPDVISPHDLNAFIQPLVHTPDQWQRTLAHRDRITETHYGLGWRTMTFGDHHLVFHAGWIRGITSLISFIPEKKVGIVILQNAELNLPFTLSMQFYDWILDLPPKQWIK
ncbi:MAG: serine hydrolase domain-containing protein [Alphaproteobacteria bacterium]|nr:serine hydrolase domain-containing protein [Alphaproteobacteria bacterium]